MHRGALLSGLRRETHSYSHSEFDDEWVRTTPVFSRSSRPPGVISGMESSYHTHTHTHTHFK